MDTCLKWTDFYALSVYFTYVRQTTPFFHRKRKRKGWITKKTIIFFKKKLFIFKTKIVHFLHFKAFSSIIIFMRCNAFLSHSFAASFPTKIISICISNLILIPLFIFVPATLQLAYDVGKRRNLFNVLLRKRDTCPTTSSRLN